ncbi:EAL domain/GGDEF domain protein [Desulfocucumis palustris]|uniref:EAL domain/GGDEF domain protein n=1 Tax=Desulfocucumis palustris TaxID=1898651 RepID=A0A2L2XAN1_9FIRM|nr:EAL domain-containing protein [Desulfocucumis palustris]GBF33238.1 EAL domain/GGDEF domain protein [Desulfocucumis palustris]
MPKNILGKLFKQSINVKGMDSTPFRNFFRHFNDRIKEVLEGNKSLVLIFIDIKDFHSIEILHGSRVAGKVLKRMTEILNNKAPEMIPNREQILLVDKLLGDEFIVVYSFEGELSYEDLQNISLSWRMAFKESLNKSIYGETGSIVDIHVGCTAIYPEGNETIESKIYSALREAQQNARGKMDPKNARLLDEFKKIIENNQFTIHYQPIVSLSTGIVLGWEALTRGPRDTHFRSPQVIFNYAAEVDLLYPVERSCRHLALKNFGTAGQEQKIFININPLTINDSNFVKGETINFIKQAGLSHRNIVFEITEQADLRNLPHFKRTLEHYRNQGYLVAIDDAGAGFSSLQAIAQIRPDFIKMDMSLVRNVEIDPVKRALLETFVTFAEKIGSFIIAEGIETENELRALINMGVHYGQGYYLGRPVYPKVMPRPELCLDIARMASKNKQLAWRHSIPVGDIVENCLTVKPNTPVLRVKKLLESNPSISGVAVLDGSKPGGLVMKQSLYGQLSTQYGVALYSNRPAKIIMDSTPLIVDWATPVETVSQVAMSREKGQIYDHIIVTRNGDYAGVVTVQNLISSLTRIQLEFAKGANPLTGLPGNNAIEAEINNRLNGSKTFMLVYVDLDNFKSYNDKYGFENGDRLLLLTSKIVGSVLRKCGNPDDFVGHLGGDDFVFITSSRCVDTVCNKIIKYFDRLVPSRYTQEDRRKKGLMGKDRDGNDKWYPFVSISIAVVECSPGIDDINSVSRNSAELKAYAKSIPGSVYTRDRRKKR